MNENLLQQEEVRTETKSELQANKPQGLSNFAVVCLMVSYAVSSGALNLPYVVYYGGPIMSSFILLFVSFIAIFTANWILEAEARIEYLKYGGKKEITDHKYEISEICEFFWSPKAKNIYNTVLFFYMSGALWSYSAVFGDTGAYIIATMFGKEDRCTSIDSKMCNNYYLISLAIFFVICFVLTLMGLKEQAVVQNTLTLYRFVSFFFMCFLAIVGFIMSEKLDGSKLIISWDLFNSKGISAMFTGLIFAQLLHHSVPGIGQTIKHKENAHRVFVYGFMVTTMIYCFIGVILAAYFGDEIKSPATLNYDSFNMFDSKGQVEKYIAYFVKYFIIIFPLPALISSYPVNAITLGNNLVASTPQSIIDKYGYRKLQIIFLSLSVIVPIGLSALVSQVPIILDISGTMGYFIMFITPGIVQLQSVKVMKEKTSGLILSENNNVNGSSNKCEWKTQYSYRFFSETPFVIFILIFAICGFIYGIVNIILNYIA